MDRDPEGLSGLRLTELLVLFSLVVWRVVRFLLRDSLIEHQRQWLYGKLIGDMTHQSALRDKIYELLDCPYCLSIWCSAAVVAVADRYTSVPLPVYMWPAASAGCMIVWRIVEDPEE